MKRRVRLMFVSFLLASAVDDHRTSVLRAFGDLCQSQHGTFCDRGVIVSRSRTAVDTAVTKTNPTSKNSEMKRVAAPREYSSGEMELWRPSRTLDQDETSSVLALSAVYFVSATKLIGCHVRFDAVLVNTGLRSGHAHATERDAHISRRSGCRSRADQS